MTRPEESETCEVEVVVEDHGIGMTLEQLAVLFQPFTKGTDERSVKKNPGGNGLGLSICRQIMKGIGGVIEAHSYPDMGSTFTVTFSAKVEKNGSTISIENDPDLQDLVEDNLFI